MATESSVLVNLKELFEMEAERRVEEAARVERMKAAEAARIEDERRAREELIEAARAEERRNAEHERARRDAALEDRLRALRGELADVRAHREEMRLALADLASDPRAPRASRGSWIAGAIAAASLALAITATAVSWPEGEGPEVARVQAAPALVSPPASVEEPAEPIPEATPEPTSSPAVEPLVAAAPVAEPRRPRGPRRHREREPSLAEQLDLGAGDEVLSDTFLDGTE